MRTNKELKTGDRVRGIAGSRKGKTGTVIGANEMWATLRWDTGKRASTVEACRLALDSEVVDE